MAFFFLGVGVISYLFMVLTASAVALVPALVTAAATGSMRFWTAAYCAREGKTRG